jgi:flagellar basal-body rod modification protein FlgD
MKPDPKAMISPEEQKQFFGDQSVGDVLNRVSDPNYVDTSKKPRAVGNNSLDKDAFFKLMLTQMKNQDPTQPMQSHEMAAQLAQFTSLEQLTNMNQSLDAMTKQNQPNANFQALALVGKKISGDSSKLTREKGDKEHDFNFSLGADAQKVTIQIKDLEGKTLRTIEAGGLKKGDNSIRWNGLADDATPARTGEYKFMVEAKATNGSKIAAKTDFNGRITGMNFTNQGPILLVGKQQIKMSDVKRIEEAGPNDMSPMRNDEAMPNMNGIPLKTKAKADPMGLQAPVGSMMNLDQLKKMMAQPPAAPTEVPAELPGAPEAEGMPVGNIDNVPMARAMQQKVAKAR